MNVDGLFEVRVGTNWPVLLVLDDKRILAVDSSECVGRYSADGGRTWGESVTIGVVGSAADAGAGPLGDLGLKSLVPTTISSLCRLADGRIGALLRTSHTGVGFFTSSDAGRTFTGGVPLGLPGENVETVNGLIQLRGGRLIAPVNHFIDDYEHPEYHGDNVGKSFRGAYGMYQGRRILVEGHDHTPEFQWVQVLYSDDLGQTWRRSVNKLWAWLDEPAEHASTHSPLCEPVATELEDGHLLMFMRSVLGRIFQAESIDGGVTWSLPKPTGLSASGSPSMLRRIPATGDLLAVWNQVSPDEIQRGLKRSRLCTAISNDRGKTWTHYKTLDVCSGLRTIGRIDPGPVRNYRAFDDIERLPDDFGSLGYPDLAFVDDTVLFAYSAQMMKPVAQWPADADALARRECFGKIKAVSLDALYRQGT